MNTTFTTTEYQSAAHTENLSIRYIKKINIVAVRGRSTGLEIVPAYTNLIQQVESHFHKNNQLKCYFHFSVINASTTKLLFKLFRLLVNAQRNGHQIEVLWVIEEDDQELIDVGLDFKNLYNLDFQITSK
tara:strand:+ start:4076 stop:4465 length:390 start_codon:yes stop_codon:yes gene_type:complete